MDKKQFKITMSFLAGAYRDKRYLDDETMDAWYRMFGNIDADIFDDHCKSWVGCSPKSPAISDLIDFCRKDQREREKGKGVIQELTDDEWYAMMEQKYGKEDV